MLSLAIALSIGRQLRTTVLSSIEATDVLQVTKAE